MNPFRSFIISGLLSLWWIHSSTAFTISPLVTATSPVPSSLTLYAENKRGSPTSSPKKKKYTKGKPKKVTLGELSNKLMQDPDVFQVDTGKKRKSRRTRRRAENPQQKYVYAAQRQKTPQSRKVDDIDDEEDLDESVPREDEITPLKQAKDLGLSNPSNQHSEALIDDVLPQILGQIRVSEDSGSGAYAYLIDKPAGWSILGKAGTKNKNSEDSSKTESKETTGNKKKAKRVKIKGEDGSSDFLDIDEDEILSLLSPEERAEFEAQGGLEDFGSVAYDDTMFVGSSTGIPGWDEVANMSPEEREEAGIDNEDWDPTAVVPDVSEDDILALLSPEEREEYEQDMKDNADNQSKEASTRSKNKNPLDRYSNINPEEMNESMKENLKRIKKRLKQNNPNAGASFTPYPRPSLVSWLKEQKAAEGTPIRGGKYWKAIAGATGVDDSGLVLLCPKKSVDNIFVDFAEYVTIVGNGENLAPQSKKGQQDMIPKEATEMKVISKVRKGREGDTCQTLQVTIPEQLSTCSSIVGQVQAQFADGIRGDPAANVFDRRAHRRLIHCNALSASSLMFDENANVETDGLPDDISILSDRLNQHKYHKGSFLGRDSLRENPLTTAYREINGAADGFPGWTVDRYGDWLFVQHDEQEYRGPLPSIHDGKTVGVYYLPSNPDRSAMGSTTKIRPTLLEGRAAPDIVPVLENGVTYHVSLDKDLSTGMFLDQRLHRAWLTRNCNEDTHVLNCFAHCGAFSIAAATAGASTVSLDLSKKWLDRVQPQLEANGIEFDERHDCIYGDCFDWLEKLSRRGEKFDIVILDPPSSSVGKKKKRWSVKNDMDELVALAAPLVKKNGLLWTTTNSAGMPPAKFARLCKKGFDSVGMQSARLERVQPMPVDFPCIGPQPVKNLVWRIP